MRVVCWAQHLTGVGHMARMRAIARELAAGHSVHLVEGGRALPSSKASADYRSVPLRPIFRAGGRLCAEGEGDIAAVLEERARQLAQAVSGIAPQVLLIEHYPFSKWELEPELTAAIAAARNENPQVRVIASLRDIAPQTRQEKASPDAYRARVTAVLNRYFDGLLVHADPNFVRLEDFFPAADDIAVPIAYTGLIVADDAVEPATTAGRHAVLSCGGGSDDMAYMETCIRAFRILREREPGLQNLSLRVFPGLGLSGTEKRAMQAATDGADYVELMQFSPNFAGYLKTARLSISRAGYNTCALTLRARVRAVLVPDSRMSDQPPRAAIMQRHGWATVPAGDTLSQNALTAAIRQALAAPEPSPDIDLTGAARTRSLLEGGFGSPTQ